MSPRQLARDAAALAAWALIAGLVVVVSVHDHVAALDATRSR